MSTARNHVREQEAGIYIGNQEDKANLSNPISRALVQGFDRAFLAALAAAAPRSILEVGCGEGRLATLMAEQHPVDILATDFSTALIAGNAPLATERLHFAQASAYELSRTAHARDVVVCCEVLEHLEEPAIGLARMHALGARYYVLSVPHEPIWRVLNMARGKYWGDLGNTPGHLNHWTGAAFGRLLATQGFTVERWLNPFPWLMVLARRTST
ncbi:class I SAM-dependent methyltransferase [Actomonas aquatica]|uniref:Class I SAM-dependent methyltransferase n=1 Tax=Actomonas aquatica TaxID=2866162 RepID=A0ABZ1C533_9BACT|nr:class I SAM-dependent methyltransferase [Opitutus sp. WL0086]WRQ86448.1 class I SAM-dependent methyltransferase [Opitutus sp. WL0086]